MTSLDLKKTLPTRPLAVPIAGGTLHVEYRPDALTPALLARLKAVSLGGTADENLDALFDACVDVLAGWDLTDDADLPIPPTRETLAELPGSLLLAVLLTIAVDAGRRPPRPPAAAARALSHAKPRFVLKL